MNKIIEGANINESVMGQITFRGLIFRWVMVLLLACGVCMWTGCGGSDNDDSDDTEETDDGGNGGGGGDVTTYDISGTVTGVEVSGVIISVSGTSSARTTTDSSGNYSVAVPAGTYTVTPTLLNYVFTPESESSVTVSTADVGDIDFVCAAATTTYTLSGTITGAEVSGVTITLYYGAGSADTTTAADGTYSFTVTDGTYAVVPSLSGYSFTPGVAVATVDGANASADSMESLIVGDRTTTSYTSQGAYLTSTSGDSKTSIHFTSTDADENAVKVAPGGGLTLTNCKVTKSGDTSQGSEGSGFYGYNSGVLASSSSSSSSYSSSTAASVTMTDCTVNTAASGANGVFAFGDNATADLSYLTIATTGSGNSGGIDATYGATINISRSIVSTVGGSSAALRSDRYQTKSPTIYAENVNGTTSGNGSPGIYCTANITATDCLLIATGSEAACIEGKNSISLIDTSISGVRKWGAIIYQSMSGDSSLGTGNFSMDGGVLINNFEDGPAFFVCDTAAVIELERAVINNASNMLLVAGTADAAGDYIDNVNSDWGTLGGTVTFTAVDQILEGEIIICDSSSSIDLTLTNSTLEGSINNDDIDCEAELTLDANSTWTVTGDSYLSTLTNNGTINGPGKIYVDGIQVYPTN